MTMGERIHDRRKACDLTLEYVGNFVGVAKSTVRNGRTVILRISARCGCKSSPTYLARQSTT